MTVKVLTYDTAHPGDTSDLMEKIKAFSPDKIRRLALLAKTEGNSDVNDYSREYGLLSAKQALEAYGGRELVERTSFLFSTGCEGAMTPFGYLFVDFDDARASSAPAGRALAIGQANSHSLAPDEIGTPAHSDIVTETVRAAMSDASVEADEVALVIVKTPVMSLLPATASSVKNNRITSAYSKTMGALGAGVALGEVARDRIDADVFGSDHSLHANRALVFSGAEFDCVEILLLANKNGAAGDLVMYSGQIEDLLDARGIRRVLAEAGCGFEDCAVTDPQRVVAMLLKGGVAPDGRIRGHRTTIRTSDLDMDKHLRATMSGIVGSILGTPRTFISANTVHQAPPGGGICACIVNAG